MAECGEVGSVGGTIEAVATAIYEVDRRRRLWRAVREVRKSRSGFRVLLARFYTSGKALQNAGIGEYERTRMWVVDSS